ncbi:hypothetical protein YB2330_005171 [Saitoella coloradoensis]
MAAVLAGGITAQGPNDTYESNPSIYYPRPTEGYFPSPRGAGLGNWSAAYESARTMVQQLNLLEKVNITTGTGWQYGPCVGNTGAVPRMGIPSLCLQDSPLGVRFADYVSAFPAGMTAAMTWDRTLMRLRGEAMGAEHHGKGVHIQLGPVAGPLGRNAAGGRNWEGFSVDPYLTGAAMYETIIGIQSQGVIACAKHFIGNEQEHFRQMGESNGYHTHKNVTDSLSANIDDQTMHELYLWPFAEAVRADVGSFMCSYNQVNNSYACQNAHLLNGLLKDELAFQGFVMTDWGAHHSGVESALSGLDMSMPGDQAFGDGLSFWGGNLTEAVVNGSVPMWRMDDMVTRILAAWYFMGQDDDYPETNFNAWTLATQGYEFPPTKQGWEKVNEHVNVMADHYKVIRQIGAEANVLLKNVNCTLPFNSSNPLAHIGIFGSDAGPGMYGPNACSDRGCDNGTLAMGWGSGSDNFPYLITPLEAIQERAVQDGTVVQWVIDDYAYSQINSTIAQVQDAPSGACLVFANADSGEGYISVDGNEGDRNNLTLWHAGDKLIQTVADQCENTIVVIHGVGTIDMESWIEHENVTAVIFAGLPGQESGNSLVDTLWGVVNPSGRLPFSIAKNREDYGTDVMYEPNFPVPQDNFTEGNLIDYRRFLKLNVTPRFWFGEGMSYSTFEYSEFNVANILNTTYAPRPVIPTLALLDESIPARSELYMPTSVSSVSKFIYPYLPSPTAEASSNATWSNSTWNEAATTTSSSAPALNSGEGMNDFSTFPYSEDGGGIGGNPSLYDVLYNVTFTVTNTGPLYGGIVPQVYYTFDDDDETFLRGFDKIFLEPGESKEVRIHLMRKDVSRYHGGWVQQSGVVSLKNHAGEDSKFTEWIIGGI